MWSGCIWVASTVVMLARVDAGRAQILAHMAECRAERACGAGIDQDPLAAAFDQERIHPKPHRAVREEGVARQGIDRVGRSAREQGAGRGEKSVPKWPPR